MSPPRDSKQIPFSKLFPNEESLVKRLVELKDTKDTDYIINYLTGTINKGDTMIHCIAQYAGFVANRSLLLLLIDLAKRSSETTKLIYKLICLVSKNSLEKFGMLIARFHNSEIVELFHQLTTILENVITPTDMHDLHTIIHGEKKFIYLNYLAFYQPSHCLQQHQEALLRYIRKDRRLAPKIFKHIADSPVNNLWTTGMHIAQFHYYDSRTLIQHLLLLEECWNNGVALTDICGYLSRTDLSNKCLAFIIARTGDFFANKIHLQFLIKLAKTSPKIAELIYYFIHFPDLETGLNFIHLIGQYQNVKINKLLHELFAVLKPILREKMLSVYITKPKDLTPYLNRLAWIQDKKASNLLQDCHEQLEQYVRDNKTLAKDIFQIFQISETTDFTLGMCLKLAGKDVIVRHLKSLIFLFENGLEAKKILAYLTGKKCALIAMIMQYYPGEPIDLTFKLLFKLVEEPKAKTISNLLGFRHPSGLSFLSLAARYKDSTLSKLLQNLHTPDNKDEKSLAHNIKPFMVDRRDFETAINLILHSFGGVTNSFCNILEDTLINLSGNVSLPKVSHSINFLETIYPYVIFIHCDATEEKIKPIRDGLEKKWPGLVYQGKQKNPKKIYLNLEILVKKILTLNGPFHQYLITAFKQNPFLLTAYKIQDRVIPPIDFKADIEDVLWNLLAPDERPLLWNKPNVIPKILLSIAEITDAATQPILISENSGLQEQEAIVLLDADFKADQITKFVFEFNESFGDSACRSVHVNNKQMIAISREILISENFKETFRKTYLEHLTGEKSLTWKSFRHFWQTLHQTENIEAGFIPVLKSIADELKKYLVMVISTTHEFKFNSDKLTTQINLLIKNKIFPSSLNDFLFLLIKDIGGKGSKIKEFIRTEMHVSSTQDQDEIIVAELIEALDNQLLTRSFTQQLPALPLKTGFTQGQNSFIDEDPFVTDYKNENMGNEFYGQAFRCIASKHYLEAEQYYFALLTIWGEKKIPQIIVCYINLSFFWINQKKLEEAHQILLRGLELLSNILIEEPNKSILTNKTHGNLAVVFYKMACRDVSKAEGLFLQAYKHALIVKHYPLCLDALNQLISTYCQKNKPDNAILILEKAREILNLLPDKTSDEYAQFENAIKENLAGIKTIKNNDAKQTPTFFDNPYPTQKHKDVTIFLIHKFSLNFEAVFGEIQGLQEHQLDALQELYGNGLRGIHLRQWQLSNPNNQFSVKEKNAIINLVRNQKFPVEKAIVMLNNIKAEEIPKLSLNKR